MSFKIACCTSSYCSFDIPPFSRRECQSTNCRMLSERMPTLLCGDEVDWEDGPITLVSLLSFLPEKNGRFGGKSSDLCFSMWYMWVQQLSCSVVYFWPCFSLSCINKSSTSLIFWEQVRLTGLLSSVLSPLPRFLSVSAPLCGRMHHNKISPRFLYDLYICSRSTFGDRYRLSRHCVSIYPC